MAVKRWLLLIYHEIPIRAMCQNRAQKFYGGPEPGVKIIGGPSTPRSPVCRRPCVSRPGRPHTSWCSDARWYSRGKTTRRTLARCRSRCTSSYSREAGTILRSPSYTGRLQRSRNLYRHVHSAPTQLNYSELSRPQLPSSVTFTSLKMF